MCGIAGIIKTSKANASIDPEKFKTMCHIQYHRGPDDYGFAYFNHEKQCLQSGKNIDHPQNGQVALSHRRLSIIDLSPRGRQPMPDQNKRYWITYNGEIYNYIELKFELQQLGFHFHTDTDTEVILNAYIQWGNDCLQKFNGMWSFAIYDKQSGDMFISRDRFGIKPLYYYQDHDTIYFASEIKAIVSQMSQENRRLNIPYFKRYIQSGYLNDSEQTLFKGIKQLLPAHYMIVSKDKMSIKKYWALSRHASVNTSHYGANHKSNSAQFRELLYDAVKLRFRSDVPVGVNLSGGLDSSAIVALTAQGIKTNLSTFTVQYLDKAFSEGDYAQQVANRYQTKAHYITPQAKDYLNFIEPFSWYHDEPAVGVGLFSQWHVMKLASKHVKVVLDGQGADEILGGYNHYFIYYLTSLIHDFIHNKGKQTLPTIIKAVQRIAPVIGMSKRTLWLTIFKHIIHRQISADALLLINRLKSHVLALSRNETTNTIFSDEIEPLSQTALPHALSDKFEHDLHNIMYKELTSTNLPQLLQNGDRTSMAFGVESRLPYLDYRVVEKAYSLHYSDKIIDNSSKRLLRSSFTKLLPQDIIGRFDKKGFPTPFSIWINHDLKEYIRDTITQTENSALDYFDKKYILNLIEAHQHGRNDHSWIIWRILNFVSWYKIFMQSFDETSKRYVISK